MTAENKKPVDRIERALAHAAAARVATTATLTAATMMIFGLVQALVEAQVIEREDVARMFEKMASEVSPTDFSGQYLKGVARMIRLLGTVPVADLVKVVN